MSLGILAGTLVVWAYSHAIGVGEAVDVLIAITGYLFIGWEAWNAIKHLVAFARLSVGAKTEADLDAAGDHLAQAITIIGVDVVIVFLTHRSVKAWKGRYRPSVVGKETMYRGTGGTNKYGDIEYSTAGTDADQALALYHETVHSFLSPKLQPLREFRADLRMEGYGRSQLLRYLEEALAETYAQLRVNGIKGIPEAVKFPVESGQYDLSWSGVGKEAAIAGAIYIGVIIVGGLTVYVFLSPN